MPIAPVAATRRWQRLINLNETLTLAPEGRRRGTTAARSRQLFFIGPALRACRRGQAGARDKRTH